jgi:predicted helicase
VPKNFESNDEYKVGWSIGDAFSVWQNGIKTDRDELFIDYNREILSGRMRTFFSDDYDEAFKTKYRVFASSSYNILEKRSHTKFNEKSIRLEIYRPFDPRWIYYERGLTSRPAWDVMQHIQKSSRCLLSSRQQGSLGFHHIFCASLITDHSILSVKSREITSVFPLYIYPQNKGEMILQQERYPNLSPSFVKALSEKLNLPQEEPHGLPKGITPEDIFYYAYAVFHSPTYRMRYAEFLKIDFPRLPLTSDLKLFRKLAAKGAELVALHLMESPALADFITEFPEKGDNVVEKVRYTDNDKQVWINPKQYFQNVPRECWEFHIGGYQVCEKWLKDRKGRKLGYEDIEHYQKIVVALKETSRLMKEIDECIPGWPIE